MVFCDLGAGQYTRDYFSEGRYAIFCNASESHNVPVINGAGQKAGRACAAGDCEIFDNGVMRLDMAGAYQEPNLKRLTRCFDFDSFWGSLKLADCFEFGNEALPVTERFVSLYAPRIEGKEVCIDTGESVTRLSCSENCRPLLREGRHVKSDGQSVSVFMIDFEFSPRNDTFTVIFTIE
jgi:hypothetical protein